MSFEQKFPHLCAARKFQDVYEQPYPVYKVEKWKGLEKTRAEYSCLSLDEMYERLRFLPHDDFFIETETGIYNIGHKDDAIVVTSGASEWHTHQGVIVGCNGVPIENVTNVRDGAHTFQLMVLQVDLLGNVSMMPNPRLKMQKGMMRSVLALVLTLLDRIYEGREVVEVFEGEETEVEDEFLEVVYKQVEEPESFIRTRWATPNEYQNSNKAGRAGIRARKRLHAVAGHWRQYKSGKRVFIRSHKRGDSSMGVVYSHLIIKGDE